VLYLATVRSHCPSGVRGRNFLLFDSHVQVSLYLATVRGHCASRAASFGRPHLEFIEKDGNLEQELKEFECEFECNEVVNV
jgi:hypothetical protein